MSAMNQVLPAHVQPLLEHAMKLFHERFGRNARYAAQAPGRVNLIGEHTDYNAGFVLPMAIERCCIVVADEASDAAKSCIVAEAVNAKLEVDLRSKLVPASSQQPESGVPVEAGTWGSHVLGVSAQFQKRDVKLRNLDAVIVSNVPLGGGLSSSASLEVSWAILNSEIFGSEISRPKLAQMCQKASHEFVGVPCGIMDQFISAVGRQGHAALIDCRDDSFELIEMPSANQATILIADTGVKHSHAGGEYVKRAQACSQAAQALGVRWLRDVNSEDLRQMLPRLRDDLAPFAEHVITENVRVYKFADALRSGQLEKAGELMIASHQSLKNKYQVSSAELDQLVEIACGTKGVYGARMTGGGFGGCIVALVDPRAVKDVSDRITDGYRTPAGGPPAVFSSRAADGAGSIKLL